MVSSPSPGHAPRRAALLLIALCLTGCSLPGTPIAPVLLALNPASAAAGSSALKLTLTGTGFQPDAQVTFASSP